MAYSFCQYLPAPRKLSVIKFSSQSHDRGQLVHPPAARVLPKLIHQSPAVHALQDVTLIIIPHGAAQLLVSHAAVLLLLAPHLRHGLGLEELEDPLPAVLPLQQTVVLLGVDEDVPDELPQVSAAGGVFALLGVDVQTAVFPAAFRGSATSPLAVLLLVSLDFDF